MTAGEKLSACLHRYGGPSPKAGRGRAPGSGNIGPRTKVIRCGPSRYPRYRRDGRSHGGAMRGAGDYWRGSAKHSRPLRCCFKLHYLSSIRQYCRQTMAAQTNSMPHLTSTRCVLLEIAVIPSHLSNHRNLFITSLQRAVFGTGTRASRLRLPPFLTRSCLRGRTLLSGPRGRLQRVG